MKIHGKEWKAHSGGQGKFCGLNPSFFPGFQNLKILDTGKNQDFQLKKLFIVVQR